ncbi:MAG: hypothetical protein H7067_15680, partial [Burkholderiales bacterium]|nr:hypothetical protein [Opitutaceae bacterium]
MTWDEQKRLLQWKFPLPRTHTGVALSNGTLGLLVWGEGRSLYVTVGYNGFWDHRGGNDFSRRINFQELREMLSKG